MDEEGSRSSITDEEDYVDDNDNGEDYEGMLIYIFFQISSTYGFPATIEEEELLDEGDYEDELKGEFL